MVLYFTVEGKPIPQGRPRVTTKFGYAMAYDSKRNKDYKQRVTERARKAIIYQSGFEEPSSCLMDVSITFNFEPPKSWNKDQKNKALMGYLSPGHNKSCGDLDNLAKSILDALNGVIWIDDSQIESLHVRKTYSKHAGASVKIIKHEPK